MHGTAHFAEVAQSGCFTPIEIMLESGSNLSGPIVVYEEDLSVTLFEYRASNSKGPTVCGTIVAESARDARDKLRALGLSVETIVPHASVIKPSLLMQIRPSRYASQLAVTVRDLATLLSTGISLLEALDTICLQNSGRFRSALLSLRERVANGSSLSEAMAEDPRFFDELTVQMVRVGENAGTLDVVLDRLAEFRERYLLFKDRIVTALIYPIIIVILAIGVSIFLMTVVLPMLLENLVEAGRPLPWPTRVLKLMSDLATNHALGFLVVGGIVGFLTMVYLRTDRGRRRWHWLIFSLPLLGDLASKQEIARAAIVISTLMKNGIVFIEAADVASRVTKNLLMREALDQMKRSVQSGSEIGHALEATGAFPPMVIQIFIIGQQTGQLEEMLDRLADSYERQVASAAAKLSAAVEPVLIVGLAVFVGFILFATILPILEAGNVL